MALVISITKRRFFLKIALDCLSIIIVGIPFIILAMSFVTPFYRGFYCDDESIKYPYKSDTISIGACACVGVIIALVTILSCEAIHLLQNHIESSLPTSSSNSKTIAFYVNNMFTVHPLLVSFYIYVGVYIFGVVVTMTMVQIGKVVIGRLRPNFLSVCNLSVGSYNCTDPNINDGTTFIYIENYICATSDLNLLKDSRMSFPSGHSAFSVFTAVYLVLYIQSRYSWHVSKLLKHLIQGLLIYLAFYVCLTRIDDNKHHWSDVFTAAVIGFFIAALTAIHVANLFRNLNTDNVSIPDTETGLVPINGS